MAAKEGFSNIIEDHDLCSRSNINILNVEVSQNEVDDILWRRVQTATSLLTYLKSNATTADLAQLEVDVRCLPVSGLFDGTELLNHVTGVMESLARRAIIAESEAAIAKGKVMLSQEEIQRKVCQIDNMSMKLEDMQKFALGSILCQMRQRVDDLVHETSTHKQRATENEQELCRVRTDFESLKSYVTRLISVRETLVSSEKQFRTLFQRLVAKTTQLESEKVQKEAEVQKLMED